MQVGGTNVPLLLEALLDELLVPWPLLDELLALELLDELDELVVKLPLDELVVKLPLDELDELVVKLPLDELDELVVKLPLDELDELVVRLPLDELALEAELLDELVTVTTPLLVVLDAELLTAGAPPTPALELVMPSDPPVPAAVDPLGAPPVPAAMDPPVPETVEPLPAAPPLPAAMDPPVPAPPVPPVIELAVDEPLLDVDELLLDVGAPPVAPVELDVETLLLPPEPSLEVLVCSPGLPEQPTTSMLAATTIPAPFALCFARILRIRCSSIGARCASCARMTRYDDRDDSGAVVGNRIGVAVDRVAVEGDRGVLQRRRSRASRAFADHTRDIERRSRRAVRRGLGHAVANLGGRTAPCPGTCPRGASDRCADIQ